MPEGWQGDIGQYWQDPGPQQGGDRWQDYVDRLMMQRYGLSQYMPGQAYGPERIESLFQGQLGGVGQALGDTPQIAAPSVGAAQQYGYGAMDLGGRAAALQAGHASAGLEGMSPAARAAAMARISQGAGAQVGALGAQGMMQGMNVLGQTGRANLQSQMQRQQALMQERMSQRGGIESALGRTMNVGMYGAEMQNALRQRAMSEREQRRRENRQRGWDVLSDVTGAAGSVAGAYAGR